MRLSGLYGLPVATDNPGTVSAENAGEPAGTGSGVTVPFYIPKNVRPWEWGQAAAEALYWLGLMPIFDVTIGCSRNWTHQEAKPWVMRNIDLVQRHVQLRRKQRYYFGGY